MFIRQHTLTVTRSTLGDGSAFSTCFNGLLHSLRIQASEAMAATDTVKVYSTNSTAVALFAVKPSTVMTEYYPRHAAVSSTGAAYSSGGVAPGAICDARLKAVVAASSTGAAATVTLTATVI